MTQIYDKIGDGYTTHRCADYRIVKAIADLMRLTPPAIIAEIGAGTGNYSRTIADLGFPVKAIEPSDTMRDQAVFHEGIEWIDGTAEKVPLPDNSVDAVLCILATHHFSSLASAIKEMARICEFGPIVWFTVDPRGVDTPWVADYFPTIWSDAFRVFPSLNDVCTLFKEHSGRHVDIVPWPVPWDLQDCFMAAGWRRPEMYLDATVRACISAFALADAEIIHQGLSRLQQDLITGQWRSIYAKLLDQETVDWGYRFLKAFY